MGLIREVGLDCAGAVQIVPQGSRTGPPRYEETSTEEIARAFDEIVSRPIGAFDRGARLSIAGAQEKLVLARRPNGRWAWPIGGAASTHILKPQMRRFPRLVENEHLCMTVAARAGLPAARVEIERFTDYLTLVVERYDRTPRGERIHQEDFAQALGSPGKYQQQNGPSLKECFEKTGVGGWTLWDQVMFAWIIGDEDKHAKNFSIMYERGRSPSSRRSTTRCAPSGTRNPSGGWRCGSETPATHGASMRERFGTRLRGADSNRRRRSIARARSPRMTGFVWIQ